MLPNQPRLHIADPSNPQTRFAREYVASLVSTLNALPLEDLARSWEVLERAYVERQQVFFAGNGGSAATASHMATDFINGITQPGKRGMRALSLTDNVPLLTAIANDMSYDEVFAKQISELGQPGDVLVVISGSGQSPNIVRAVEEAKERGMATIGFLGMGGGTVGRMVDHSVIVPADDYGPIEDIHMVLDHLTVAYFRWHLAALSGRATA